MRSASVKYMWLSWYWRLNRWAFLVAAAQSRHTNCGMPSERVTSQPLHSISIWAKHGSGLCSGSRAVFALGAKISTWQSDSARQTRHICVKLIGKDLNSKPSSVYVYECSLSVTAKLLINYNDNDKVTDKIPKILIFGIEIYQQRR